LPKEARTHDNAQWVEVTNLEKLIDALIGSTAIPIVFPPHKDYFDGGVLLNQPISPALRLKHPDVLYVIIPSPDGLGNIENMVSIGSTLVGAWLASSLLAQINQVKILNELNHALGDPLVKLCVVRPAFDLTKRPAERHKGSEQEYKLSGFSLLGFGDRVEDLVQAGRDAAHLQLLKFDPNNEGTWY
jgi:predicted acylesterase/phospholipase RssA